MICHVLESNKKQIRLIRMSSKFERESGMIFVHLFGINNHVSEQILIASRKYTKLDTLIYVKC